MKRPLFNCSQTYIEHGYVELFVPADKNNKVGVPCSEIGEIFLPSKNSKNTIHHVALRSVNDKHSSMKHNGIWGDCIRAFERSIYKTIFMPQYNNTIVINFCLSIGALRPAE